MAIIFLPKKAFHVHVFMNFVDKNNTRLWLITSYKMKKKTTLHYGFLAGLISGILVFMSAVCVRLKQHEEEGPRTLSLSQTYRKQRCQPDSNLALCSDDDLVRSIIDTTSSDPPEDRLGNVINLLAWDKNRYTSWSLQESKCPSGCRMQGLIWQLESKMDKNLHALCKTAMGHHNTALRSMTLVTDIYKYNRQTLVKRHSKTIRHSPLENVLINDTSANENCVHQ